jgi:hypothetical protein
MYIKYFGNGDSIHVRGELINEKQEGLWEEYYESPYFMKSLNHFKGVFFMECRCLGTRMDIFTL